MQLIYIITYDCNFRCKYCDVLKKKDSISFDVLDKSFDFFSSNKFDIKKIKLFWWEPLLYKDKIRYLVDNSPNKNNADFFITTNSSLIDNDFIWYCNNNKISLTFSIDWDKDTNKKNRVLKNWEDLSNVIIENTKKYKDYIKVNQVITSNTSKDLFYNFKFLYDLGIRKFNFLPEYYKEWSKKWLLDLNKWFEEIISFYKEWHYFELVNLENYSDISFFNFWMVIDTDGSLYWTNLILSWKFEKYKKILKIWDINKWIFNDIFNNNFNKNIYFNNVNEILNKEYKKNELNSVLYIDKILNNFCLSIEEKSKQISK